MAASSLPLLRLSGVEKKFGATPAVWNVDLDVYPGDFLAIFGPNGAGKTTLLRIVASLTPPTRGSLEFPLGGAQASRRRVGYVSHQSLLYNELTGFENLLFYGRLYALKDLRRRAEEMLQKMGLADSREQLVRGYSRGMKQRLTLARALLHDPQLLLLDEPFTGLDQHGSRLLTDILKSLRQESRTVLLSTHNMSEGLELCTRVVIQQGEIVFQAPRNQVSNEEFERLYFQAVRR